MRIHVQQAQGEVMLSRQPGGRQSCVTPASWARETADPLTPINVVQRWQAPWFGWSLLRDQLSVRCESRRAAERIINTATSFVLHTIH